MAIAPLLIGFAPYAVVVGSVIGAHSSPAAGWAGTWLIFGGSAHLATLNALDDGSALLAALTGLLVNARLLVYSASLGGRWRHQPTLVPLRRRAVHRRSDMADRRPARRASQERWPRSAATSSAPR